MEPIKVLIIDREPEFASILTHHLNSWGFAATAAAGEGEALEAMERIVPEVVVLGLEAREKEDFQTFEWIRTHFPAVQIILLAGKASALSVVNGIRRGAFDVLSLPIELGVLCETIRRAHHNRLKTSGSHPPNR